MEGKYFFSNHHWSVALWDRLQNTYICIFANGVAITTDAMCNSSSLLRLIELAREFSHGSTNSHEYHRKNLFLRCTRKLECAYKNVNNRLVLHTRRRLQQQQHNLIARNLESVQNFCFSAWSLVLPKKSRMTVTSMRRMSPNNVHFSPKLFGRPMKTVLNKPFYVQ